MVQLTATVSPVGGSTTPTGKVVFLDGSSQLGTADLQNGKASLGVSALAVATHSITANYNGNIFYVPSVSAVLSQTVNPDNTMTVLSSSLNPSVYLQSVTFKAVVQASRPGSGTPTGNVSFLDGSTVLATVTLDSTGTATFTTTTLSVGSHNIQAQYAGSVDYNPSNSNVVVQVVKPATTTPLLLALNDAGAGAGRGDLGSTSNFTGISMPVLIDQSLAVDGSAPIERLSSSPISVRAQGYKLIKESWVDLDRFFASLDAGLA
jgi:hypothetical protein